MRWGDVVCAGWLRKSPPEKKLRRYRNVRHAYFFCCFRYWQDCPHNGEIWILFFLLSASISVAGAVRQDFHELRTLLKKHKQDFQNSDATYYTPSYKILEDCVYKVLLCYTLEAQVILYETKGERSITQLEPMADHFQLQSGGNKSCPPCEASEETNSTTFIDSFLTVLQKVEDVAHSTKYD